MNSRLRWCCWGSRLILMLGCAACTTTPGPVVSQMAAGEGPLSVTSGTAEESSSWQPEGRGGRLDDSRSGFSLELPPDWTWRRGTGATLFVARGPAALPVRLELLSWAPDAEGGELRSADDALVFMGSGPYAGLDDLSDEPPVVLTREVPGRREMLLSWLFAVEKRGLRLNALLPSADFEQAWRTVDAIVRSGEVAKSKY